MEKSAYEILNNLQFNHWWFIGRSSIIKSFIDKNIENKNLEILDVGSGYGALIPTLKDYGNVECVEPFVDSKDNLLELGANEVYNYKDFPVVHPDKKYNLVTFFDVVEHIEDDESFLNGVITNILDEKGKIIITVPAYKWLWTNHDDEHRHYRRYTKSMLVDVVKKAGYKNIKANYFMTFLFPLAVLSRFKQKILKNGSSDLKPMNSIINKVFYKIFSFERKIINNLNLPFGLSIILVAEK